MLTAYLFVLLPSLAVLLVADAVPPEVVGVGANNGGNNRRYLRSLVPLRILAASILSHGEIRTRDVPDLCPFNTTCPDGSTARQTGFQIVPNGCGPEGLRSTSFFVPNERVTSCCDQHDICYATCGRSKKGCDNLLRCAPAHPRPAV